jgi:alkyldihydroxyacetonephosphate synthase
VRALLDWAQAQGVLVIPVGGATSVVGHLRPEADEPRPVLALAMARLRALSELDETAQLATFEAGVTGPDLEPSCARAASCWATSRRASSTPAWAAGW